MLNDAPEPAGPRYCNSGVAPTFIADPARVATAVVAGVLGAGSSALQAEIWFGDSSPNPIECIFHDSHCSL